MRANAFRQWGLAFAFACAPLCAQASVAAPASRPAADDIPFASPHAAAVSVPSAPTAWGGPRTGNEATLSDRVVKYRIQATLDPDKHTVIGKQQLTWRNRSDRTVSAVFLHLYLNAFEGAGSTFATEQRESGFGFRSGVKVDKHGWGYMRLRRVAQGGANVPWRYVQPDGGPATDRTVVRFDLPTPVAPGESTTLDIDFFDQLPRVSARTGHYGTFHLVAQWFPKIGVLELPGERGATTPRWNVHEFHLHSEFYADFGEYDVSITVPKGYTVGATGELQGTPVERGGNVTHRYVQGDVHDFAWTADKRYAKPLDAVYRGVNGPVQVRVLYPPEYASNAPVVMKATLDSLKYFSETLGPYPYRTVTAVVPPYNAREAGGMEYPTFFTADSMKEVSPDQPSQYLLDFVTIHEFGHGYFYGILGSNEFEEPMLDEGLNEYWNQRMMLARKQQIHASGPLSRALGIELRAEPFEIERLAASREEPADGLGGNAWDRYSSRSYTSVYWRTATMMRDLEAQLGTATMERAFKQYYARWKFRHPSIADLRESLAESSGQRALVERVFAQQVYATREIDDHITSLQSEALLPRPGMVEWKGKPVELTQSQIDEAVAKVRERWRKAHPKAGKHEDAFPYRTHVMVRRSGATMLPQTLQVRFADGSVRNVRWNDDARWKRFSFTTRSRAVSAQLDPQRRIFLDRDKLDDGRLLESNGAASRRWSSDLAALLQSFYALLVSL